MSSSLASIGQDKKQSKKVNGILSSSKFVSNLYFRKKYELYEIHLHIPISLCHEWGFRPK